MIVELTEVSGPSDREGVKVGINPAHVVKVQRGINASNPDEQAFVTELTLVVGGKMKVAGAPHEITAKLNSAGVR